MLIECDLDMMCDNDTFSFWSFSSKPVTLVILLLKGGVCLLATQKPIKRPGGKGSLLYFRCLYWGGGEGRVVGHLSKDHLPPLTISGYELL